VLLGAGGKRLGTASGRLLGLLGDHPRVVTVGAPCPFNALPLSGKTGRMIKTGVPIGAGYQTRT